MPPESEKPGFGTPHAISSLRWQRKRVDRFGHRFHQGFVSLHLPNGAINDRAEEALDQSRDELGEFDGRDQPTGDQASGISARERGSAAP